jgi:tRNA(fMet)-specific endonuclease VapC
VLFHFDTNAVSDYMDRHPRLRARLAAMGAADEVRVSTIVRGEILFGIEQMPTGQRKANLEARATSAFALLRCEPIPPAAAEHYARLKLACRDSGVVIDENDLWIAATALALGATLVTRDKDFSRVPGLPIEDWTA